MWTTASVRLSVTSARDQRPAGIWCGSRRVAIPLKVSIYIQYTKLITLFSKTHGIQYRLYNIIMEYNIDYII